MEKGLVREGAVTAGERKKSMKRKTRKKEAVVFLAFFIMALLMLMRTILKAEAKTGDRMVTKGGYTYILRDGRPRTGWITYKGHRYYAHETASRIYPKGAVTKDQCRVKNGKMYYFDSSGKKITRSTRTRYESYELNKHSTSIRYIYKTRGSRRGAARYNCMNHHLQYLVDGKWKDSGWGYWWDGIDWQY